MMSVITALQSGLKGASSWITANLVTSGVIVALVTSGVSLYTSVSTAREKSLESERAFDEDFVKLLRESILEKTKALASSGRVEDEQQAAVSLLALEGLASTENERGTILLVGARLLNASSTREDTGHPAARFLNVVFGEIEQQLAEGVDKQENQDLLNLMRSPSFVDLVSAGYADEYYKDEVTVANSPIQPTLLGDQPITHPAKAQLLYEIGPNSLDGWIDVGTWRTDIRVDLARAVLPATLTTDQIAHHMTTVLFDHVNPMVNRSQLSRHSYPTGVRLLDARLLRDRAPSVFVYQEKKSIIKIGDLGRVIGAVPAAACVDFVEQLVPVLVFINPRRLGESTGRKDDLVGLVHVWGHVTLAKQCSDGLASLPLER
jgi:hypothetical protein